LKFDRTSLSVSKRIFNDNSKKKSLIEAISFPRLCLFGLMPSAMTSKSTSESKVSLSRAVELNNNTAFMSKGRALLLPFEFLIAQGKFSQN
jgi:hypothetical protein